MAVARPTAAAAAVASHGLMRLPCCLDCRLDCRGWIAAAAVASHGLMRGRMHAAAASHGLMRERWHGRRCGRLRALLGAAGAGCGVSAVASSAVASLAVATAAAAMVAVWRAACRGSRNPQPSGARGRHAPLPLAAPQPPSLPAARVSAAEAQASTAPPHTAAPGSAEGLWRRSAADGSRPGRRGGIEAISRRHCRHRHRAGTWPAPPDAWVSHIRDRRRRRRWRSPRPRRARLRRGSSIHRGHTPVES